MPLCVTRCMNVADCWLDGVPYCFDCVELLLDREVAYEINPEGARMLPTLFER